MNHDLKILRRGEEGLLKKKKNSENISQSSYAIPKKTNNF